MQYCETGAIRPSLRPPNTIRPSILPADPTSSNDFDGIRRPGIGKRPKFPIRTTPSGQSGDGLVEGPNLIASIPVDRPDDQQSNDENVTDGDLQEDGNPRVQTGGPFIPNFGGGGRPGRPVKINRDQNTGTGSATLQKVNKVKTNLKKHNIKNKGKNG